MIELIDIDEHVDVRTMVSGRTWIILEDFRCTVKINDVILKIEVPAGFITDFASVPRILWSWIPPIGKYSRAAVIHDWLYNVKDITDRKTADKIFRVIMRHLEVGKTRAQLMYTAVRVGAKRW